jgi:hypothetical protein
VAGVHFGSADTAAGDMGLRLTSWTLDHYFQRVQEER